MHELSIAMSLLEAARQAARPYPDRSVIRLMVRVGALRAIVPEMMRTAWQAASLDTELEGADLLLERVDAAGRCRRCGETFAVEDLWFVCPACGSGDVETIRGMELMLDRMELEERSGEGAGVKG